MKCFLDDVPLISRIVMGWWPEPLMMKHRADLPTSAAVAVSYRWARAVLAQLFRIRVWIASLKTVRISYDELPGKFLRSRHVAQLHVIGQTIPEWRIRFADNQRCQIAAGGFGNAEAVGANEIARQ